MIINCENWLQNTFLLTNPFISKLWHISLTYQREVSSVSFSIATIFLFCCAGQRILHHKSNILETVVLINPSDEAVSTEVKFILIVVDDLLYYYNIIISATWYFIFHPIKDGWFRNPLLTCTITKQLVLEKIHYSALTVHHVWPIIHPLNMNSCLCPLVVLKAIRSPRDTANALFTLQPLTFCYCSKAFGAFWWRKKRHRRVTNTDDTRFSLVSLLLSTA